VFEEGSVPLYQRLPSVELRLAMHRARKPASSSHRVLDPAAAARREKLNALLGGEKKTKAPAKPAHAKGFHFRSVDTWTKATRKNMPASVANGGDRRARSVVRNAAPRALDDAAVSWEPEEKGGQTTPSGSAAKLVSGNGGGGGGTCRGAPSLLDLAARAIGDNYHLIPNIGESFLPQGTLIRALENICRAGLLTDAHIDLFYATLPVEPDTGFLYRSSYATASMAKELQMVRRVTDSSLIFTRNHQSAQLMTLYNGSASASHNRLGERVESAVKDRYNKYDPLRPSHLADEQQRARALREEKQRKAKEAESTQVLPFLFAHKRRELRQAFRVDLHGQRRLSELGFCELAECIGLARFKHIVHVDLSFCANLTNKALAAIGQACGDSLLKLDITGCQRISNAGITALTEACRAIESISYELCHKIDDRALQDTVHNLTSLASINLGSCKKLSNVGFQIVSAHGKALKHINANGSAQLTDLGLEDLSKCISMYSLSLRTCRRITDTGVREVVKLCMRQARRKSISLEEGPFPVLKHLDLGGCSRITDKSVLAPAAKSQLEYLDLRGLTKLTDAVLPALATQLPNLKYLNLACCDGLSPDKLVLLRARRPELRLDS
jgi:F-box/leucine-rich repeat protein 2/20